MGKRKLVGTALVSGIMLLSTLTGCGKDTATQPAASTKPVESQAAAAPTPKPASPVKLKLAMWDAKGDLTFWQEKVKEYTKLKPNVTGRHCGNAFAESYGKYRFAAGSPHGMAQRGCEGLEGKRGF